MLGIKVKASFLTLAGCVLLLIVDEKSCFNVYLSIGVCGEAGLCQLVLPQGLMAFCLNCRLLGQF
jgi:hypothetical protein